MTEVNGDTRCPVEAEIAGSSPVGHPMDLSTSSEVVIAPEVGHHRFVDNSPT